MLSEQLWEKYMHKILNNVAQIVKCHHILEVRYSIFSLSYNLYHLHKQIVHLSLVTNFIS